MSKGDNYYVPLIFLFLFFLLEDPERTTNIKGFRDILNNINLYMVVFDIVITSFGNDLVFDMKIEIMRII